MDVKSAWLSKINWTQGIGLIAMLLTFFGVTVPPEIQNEAMAIIASGTAVLTWVFRTFFTKSVTPSVAAKLP